MAKKIKIGLIGATGKMGSAFRDILANSNEFEYFLAIAKAKIPQATHSQSDLKESKNAALVDVWIDFSSAEIINDVLSVATKYKKPLVIGTTGYSEKQKDLISKAAQKIPLLCSGNMSLGIQILLRALEAFKNSSGFEFQIEEFHHNKKKDAPSGTGLMIKAKLDQVVKMKTPDIVSIRGGGIFGIHKVIAMAEEEVITIEHSALNRTVFARGALLAAKELNSRRPGLYSLKDLI